MKREYFVDLTQRMLPGREANFEFQAKSSDATEFMPVSYTHLSWLRT